MDQGFALVEVLLDADGRPDDYRVLELNPQFERLTGQTASAYLSGRTVREVAPELEQEWFDFYGAVATTGVPGHREVRAEAWGRWFEVRAFRVGEPAQRRVAILFTDISERRGAEAALRASERQAHAIARSLPGCAVFVYDRDLRYQFAGGAALDAAGQSPDAFVGRTVREALPPDLAALFTPYLERALGGAPFLHEHASFGRSYVSRGVPLTDTAGAVESVLVVSYDVTEKRQAEEALRASEADVRALNQTLEERVRARTERIRRLLARLNAAEDAERRRLADVLHEDLQQQLAGLSMLLGIAARAPADAAGLIAECAGIVQQAVALTRAISAELSPQVLADDDFGEAVRWLARHRAGRHGLSLAVEVDEPCPVPDAGARTVLYESLRELVRNVDRHAGTRRATVRARRAGPDAVVEVEDDGAGIAPDASPAGGLANVTERVELAGGRVEIDSAPGRGTRVTVCVPAGDAA